jgi:hypothetical protein
VARLDTADTIRALRRGPPNATVTCLHDVADRASRVALDDVGPIADA